MKIKAICVNCTAIESEEGDTFGLMISIVGLDQEHVVELSERLKGPIKAVLEAVVGEDGQIPVEHIDAAETVQ